jgi:hypothetical protein
VQITAGAAQVNGAILANGGTPLAPPPLALIWPSIGILPGFGGGAFVVWLRWLCCPIDWLLIGNRGNRVVRAGLGCGSYRLLSRSRPVT